MRKVKRVAVKRESMETEALSKDAVVLTFSIAHVANDGVSNMFEMFANLMRATCFWDCFQKAVSLKST